MTQHDKLESTLVKDILLIAGFGVVLFIVSNFI
jgi:hypothetical protein